MKIGTLQNVIEQPLDSLFTTAAKLGFDGVELDWSDPDWAQPGGRLAPDNCPAIRRASAEAGVEIPSVAAHFLSRGGITLEETEAFGLEIVRTGIRICADLGARYLLVPFFAAAEIKGISTVSRLVKNLQQLAPDAEAAGIVLAIEHTMPAELTAEVLDNVNSPNVGNYWDMGNSMALGADPLEEIAHLGPRIARVHAKEYHQGSDPPGSRYALHFDGLNRRPFGQGDVPVPAVLDALLQVGYDDYIVLETGKFDHPAGSAQDALNYLRTLTAAQT
ncbi:MAG: sugar phosphate isomerase/epimerase [Caldilineaceae bacterium]|nr:sugar phosphate isomerase/epimerase [Caldilineaceae bacterium]MCY4092197.1 sugar phosphate isomerase/epimerase [Caldilineaceae bacterium]